MAIDTFTIVLEEPLRCGACDELLIKVNDRSLLAVNDGVPVGEQQSFMRGAVVEYEEVSAPGRCGGLFRYTIQYDDVQLLDPDFELSACDINRVCCADCLLEFVDEIDFNHALNTTECGEVILIRPDGTSDTIFVETCTQLPIEGTGLTGDPVSLLLSTDAGNQLILGGDSGLFYTETVTTLVDNADNTFTYTSEDATVTNFDVAHTLSEPAANTVRLTRPDGTFDDVTITETITTLVDNGNDTFTYTSEDATVTNFNAAHALTEPAPGTIRLTRPGGTFDEINIVGAPDVITTLVDNGDNTFTYTSEDATVTNFDAEHDLSSPVLNTVRLTRPDATTQDVALPVSTLVDNANDSFTYTNETGGVTNFDAQHDLTEPVTNTFRLTRPGGTFQEVSVTFPAEHTVQQDTAGFTDTGTPWVFTSAAAFLSDITTLVINNPSASRVMLSDVFITFRPNFVFDGSDASPAEIIVNVAVSEDFAIFSTVASYALGYNFVDSDIISRTEPIIERLFTSVPAGGSKNIRIQLGIVSTNIHVASQLAGLNGGLSAFSVTV